MIECDRCAVDKNAGDNYCPSGEVFMRCYRDGERRNRISSVGRWLVEFLVFGIPILLFLAIHVVVTNLASQIVSLMLDHRFSRWFLPT